jgi:hypothetical protein
MNSGQVKVELVTPTGKPPVVVVTATRDSKHHQHVSHWLSALRLDTVEQPSGALGAKLAANRERLGSWCDHALREGRLSEG